MEWWSWIQEGTSTGKWVASALAVIAVIALRYGLRRWLQSSGWLSEKARLAWRVRLNNAALVAMVASLVAIWSTQVQTFALSAVALAAALVVATKELILCVSGGFLRATTRSFAVGDRIEVSGQRGEVIDLGFLTTTIL